MDNQKFKVGDPVKDAVRPFLKEGVVTRIIDPEITKFPVEVRFVGAYWRYTADGVLSSSDDPTPTLKVVSE